MFAIRALRELEDFLGIQVDLDRAGCTMSISQESKALALVELCGLEGAREAVPCHLRRSLSFGLCRTVTK
jgi:hypothetical protein